MTLVVLAPGPLTTIQDAGRPGMLHLGVPVSGAVDRRAYELGNRLVGNRAGAASLEVTLGGLVLRADAPAVVAISGAPVKITVDGGVARPNAPLRLTAGSTIRLGIASAGLRIYVAVRGGVDAPLSLGSRSTDTLTGLGPAPMRAGALVHLASDTLETVPEVGDAQAMIDFSEQPSLKLGPGPRTDWLAPETLNTLFAEPFSVTAQSSRVGIRLNGPRLPYREPRSLASEPVLAGSLQLPPDGNPILLLVDHPTTGGYPVIGVLSRAELARAAQLRPGQRLRFVSDASSGVGTDR